MPTQHPPELVERVARVVRRCPCGAYANSSGLCSAHKRQAERIAAGIPTKTESIAKAQYALGLARTR